MSNLTKKEIKTKIRDNEYEIMMLERFIYERYSMIDEVYRDYSDDLSIASDSSYLAQRMDEEIKKIDKQLKSYEQMMLDLTEENIHLKTLLNAEKGELKWLRWLKKFRLQ